MTVELPHLQTPSLQVKKVNRPRSPRAARLSRLTASELLPPRPTSARAALTHAAAATAAVGLLARDAGRGRGCISARQYHGHGHGDGGRGRDVPPAGTAWMKPPVPTFRVRKTPPVRCPLPGADVSPYLQTYHKVRGAEALWARSLDARAQGMCLRIQG